MLKLKKWVKAFVPYGLLCLYKKLKLAKKIKETPQNEEYLNFNFTLFDGNKSNSYGQGGEDLLLRLFMNKPITYKGFYVDIGAFHPVIFSNTKYFYDQGWNGINIDANSSSIIEFDKSRCRDINVLCGVSDEYGELDYYYFGEHDTINTLDKEQAYAFEKEFKRKIQTIKKMPVQPINAILDKHCPAGQHIDFITIDVEGFEIKILKSLDFMKYGPDYFLIEALDNRDGNIEGFKQTTLYRLLKDKGYEVIGKTPLTYLFIKKDNHMCG
jgi:hypothetical protein